MLALRVSKSYCLKCPTFYWTFVVFFVGYFVFWACKRFYYGDASQRTSVIYVVISVLLLSFVFGIFCLSYVFFFDKDIIESKVFSFGDLVFYKYFWEDDSMLSEGLKFLETKGASDLFNASEFKRNRKKK